MADYTSPFATGIQFLDRLGVYEVLLPFLLIFTLVFAILEKTRLFGTDEVEGIVIPKKNLNSMFAFVTSFIVVASSRLVSTINEAMGNMVILMLLAFCFMLLVGVFHTGKDEMEINKTYKNIFMVIMFVGIIFIFLHAIKTPDGTPWLYFGWGYITNNIDTGAMGALILTIFIVVLMGYITGSSGTGALGIGGNKDKKEE